MRADIHDGQEHERSIHGPDTEAQDQSPPSLTSSLQHTAGPYSRVLSAMRQVRFSHEKRHSAASQEIREKGHFRAYAPQKLLEASHRTRPEVTRLTRYQSTRVSF